MESARPSPIEHAFLIVGIGASAGGLSAFRDLLQALPTTTGMGFIFIQHLDPTHISTLPALLARTTAMPVVEAQDGQVVEPNHVYVIPPDTALGILHGKLQLLPRLRTGHRHLPIDQFFCALAEDRDSQAIGVILSGTASDGTLGLKAIKAAGGITFAQDEQSAEYDGMPHSAVAAGCVDFVLPPAKIAAELAQIARHPYASRKLAGAATVTSEGENSLNKVFFLLRSRTGNDFTYYKHSTIGRRLRRRMLLHKLERLPEYVKLLQRQPAEVDALFHDLLINVTSFFRDPDAFEALKRDIFPRIFGQRAPDTPVRVWVPGCSTGEEAYTIAILLLEFLNDHATTTPIQIFATDIDAQAIDKARMGVYPDSITEDVEPGRLRRFFVKLPIGYQISKSVRDLCVFAVQNVNKDPPFSRLDLICCRNLLIYLGSVLQKKVLKLFHYALRSPGFLMLGTSETVGEVSDLFAPVDKQNKLYEKKTATVQPGYEFPTQPDLVMPPHRQALTIEEIPTVLNVQQEAERVILGRYVPPGVVIDQDMNILHFYGKTAPFLEPGAGPASLNLMRMTHPDLLIELRNAVKKALKQGNPYNQPAHLRSSTGQDITVLMKVIPLNNLKGAEKFLLVLFETLGAGARPDVEQAVPPSSPSEPTSEDEKEKRIKGLEEELRTTRDYMQAIIEDQEATNEEFKAANEEIQSTNEELQSTNEELETAKEELQSMNEELATVNEELENRNVALTQSNNDLTNILSSVDMAIIMLDRDLRIRLFTSMAKNLLNLIDTDVGRPLSDLKPKVAIPELDRLALQVLDTLTPISKEVSDPEGHWYSVRVRPYRTLNNQIDGAVIAFIGIDDIKDINRLKDLLLQQEQQLATMIGDSLDAILVLDLEGRILAWNPGAARIYGYTELEAIGMNIEDLIPEDQRAETRQLLEHLKASGPFKSGRTQRLTKSGERVTIKLTASVLYDETGKPSAVATTERVQ